MADAPYLIAIALLQQGGSRAMPLQGKSLRSAIAADADPAEVGREQLLALLLRVCQRSDAGPLARARNSNGLLLAELPIEALQAELPQLKADWLNSGDTEALLAGLRRLAGGIWRVSIEARAPMGFERLQ